MFRFNRWHTLEGTESTEALREAERMGQQVCERIRRLDLKAMGLSEYNQRYIQEAYTEPERWSHNSLMCAWILTRSDLQRGNISLLDYGAGCGSICLLAKALGIGCVIYSDIYEVSCRDASILGQALGLRADHYVTGELNEVIRYMADRDLSCNVLASNACIEHIYNIEAFFEHLPMIPAKKLYFWLSTGANPLRPRTLRLLAQGAVQAEFQDREKQWGHKERDTTESFMSIRKRIIGEEAGHLTAEEIQVLARKTRGLRQDDIRKTVHTYLQSGCMPKDPEHPTNTCDPWTGNWAERLMDPFYLSAVLTKNGAATQVAPLYWGNDSRSSLKRCVKAGMNLFMSYFPKYGLRFSPGYILLGTFAR